MNHAVAKHHPVRLSLNALLELARSLEHRSALTVLAQRQLMSLADESPRHTAQLTQLMAHTEDLADRIGEFRSRVEEVMAIRGDLAPAAAATIAELDRLRSRSRDCEARAYELLHDALLTDLGDGD